MSESTTTIERAAEAVTLDTKAEALRRLRLAAQLARRATGAPANARVEVGLRTRPVYANLLAEAGIDEADDLAEFATIDEAHKLDEVRRPGYVAHLYVSRKVDGQWELDTTITVWLGNDATDPVVLSVPGTDVHASVIDLGDEAWPAPSGHPEVEAEAPAPKPKKRSVADKLAELAAAEAEAPVVRPAPKPPTKTALKAAIAKAVELAAADGKDGVPARRFRHRKARQTGVIVTTGHGADLGLADDTEAPWYNICGTHVAASAYESYALARAEAVTPAGWCEACQGIVEAAK